jgi:hypothetical protein
MTDMDAIHHIVSWTDMFPDPHISHVLAYVTLVLLTGPRRLGAGPPSCRFVTLFSPSFGRCPQGLVPFLEITRSPLQ